MLKLDVGCGDRPKGDVNVDLYKHPTIHCNFEINPKTIKNFVLADAHHLPFRAKVFDIVRSSHTIEHVDNPMLMLKEMARVSKHLILIRCPHRFTLNRNKSHKNKLCPSWFQKAFRLLNLKNPNIKIRYGLLGIPEELTVKGKVNNKE